MSDEARKKQRGVGVADEFRGEQDVRHEVARMVKRHDDHDQAAQHIH